MIATSVPSRAFTFAIRLVSVGGVLVISLVTAIVAGRIQWYAVGVAVFAVLAALTVWRPRYGLYAVLVCAIAFEGQPSGPVMHVGWHVQSTISSWSPFGFVIFSPIELMVLVTALVVVAEAVVEHRRLQLPQLGRLMIFFLFLVTMSVAYGIFAGGDLNIALWETRSIYLIGAIALLVPNVFKQRGQVDQLLNVLVVAATLLSIEIIWRRFALFDTGKLGLSIDMVFAHDSPVMINFVIVLLVARLVWPASGRQRLTALRIQLLIWAQMLTERRAGWVSLDIGLVLVAIMIFRVRRKLFAFFVLPLLLLYVGYLGAFWNADGPIAQPARAVRSINSPEGRDLQSNLYRMGERLNVRANIRAHPLTGLGWGKEYTFYYGLADLSWWRFWRYSPHASLLGLWMKMGPLGMLTFLTLTGAAIARGVQLIKQAPNDRSAPVLVALVSGSIMLFVYSYVELGLSGVRTTALWGFAFGVIGAWGREAIESAKTKALSLPRPQPSHAPMSHQPPSYPRPRGDALDAW